MKKYFPFPTLIQSRKIGLSPFPTVRAVRIRTGSSTISMQEGHPTITALIAATGNPSSTRNCSRMFSSGHQPLQQLYDPKHKRNHELSPSQRLIGNILDQQQRERQPSRCRSRLSRRYIPTAQKRQELSIQLIRSPSSSATSFFPIIHNLKPRLPSSSSMFHSLSSTKLFLHRRIPSELSSSRSYSMHPFRYFATAVRPTTETSQGSTDLSINSTSTTRVSDNSSKFTDSVNLVLSFDTTPLGRNGRHLLKGLDLYQVPSKNDAHPLAVYGINSQSIQKTSISSIKENDQFRPPILLLHGRTWSSVPVYHLMGGEGNAGGHKANHPGSSATCSSASRSTMEALYEHGLQPYAMDFRGFGGTHRDGTGYVEPMLCVTDMESVMEWIAERHYNNDRDDSEKTATSSSTTNNIGLVNLLGWSQGAMVAQLGAQKLATTSASQTCVSCGMSSTANNLQQQERNLLLNKLILYGSIYDPLVRYEREPLYRLNNQPNQTYIPTTFDMAIEDFTLEGSIPPEPAKQFAEAALLSDPIKAVWKHVYQFNNCDPARVQHPTLVIGGDQDPYAPLRVQLDLFGQLGRGAGTDRVWTILADCDHAVHLLNHGRERFIQHVAHFVKSD